MVAKPEGARLDSKVATFLVLRTRRDGFPQRRAYPNRLSTLCRLGEMPSTPKPFYCPTNRALTQARPTARTHPHDG